VNKLGSKIPNFPTLKIDKDYQVRKKESKND
jgi:hypothetical protein